MSKYFFFGSGAGKYALKDEDFEDKEETEVKNPSLQPISGFNLSSREKDKLHAERKRLVEDLSHGIMSVGQMMDGETKHLSHDEQVSKYDKWKDHNTRKMERFHEINRKFKHAGIEGRLHTLDDIRNATHRKEKVKYD